MIPIAPLDGSQIFSGLLIGTNPELVRNLQIYGPQILMGYPYWLFYPKFHQSGGLWVRLKNFFSISFRWTVRQS
ncbi:MAG: hypothetical protein CM1200mP10_13140 [Candidatus Neomarinimicrobiota bacterium]|nr:MAG: hypothetical protein CM1200mP10_13140 [Candidatus Neomarinimicrobiota bacterium]